MNKNHKLSPSLKETSDFKTNKKTQERIKKEQLDIVIDQLIKIFQKGVKEQLRKELKKNKK